MPSFTPKPTGSACGARADRLKSAKVRTLKGKYMRPLRYREIHSLLQLVDEPNRSKVITMLNENWERFCSRPGSSNKHHAWRGGYIDHVVEAINIFRNDFVWRSLARQLPFSMSDGILVCFLHDLEKAWLYGPVPHGRRPKIRRELHLSKAERKEFRAAKIAEYNIELTPDHENALLFVEGEPDELYNPIERLMGPLAALCHNADNWSARGWYDYPKRDGTDTWLQSAKPIKA